MNDFDSIKKNIAWWKRYVFSNIAAAVAVFFFVWSRPFELNQDNNNVFFVISFFLHFCLCFLYIDQSKKTPSNPDVNANTLGIDIIKDRADLIKDGLFSESLIVEDKKLSIKIYSFSGIKNLFSYNKFSLISLFLITIPPILLVVSTKRLLEMPIYMLELLMMSAACYFFTIFLVFALLQMPNIIAFAQIQPIDSDESNNPNKSKSELELDAEIFKIDTILKPVISTMSDDNGTRLRNLYIGAAKARIEIKAISQDFNMPYNSFADQLGALNEITEVFIPATVKNFKKIFSNTMYKIEIKEVLGEDVQYKVASSIHLYENKLLEIGTYLFNIRLSAFSSSEISDYTNNIRLICYKIELMSGTDGNAAIVIAKSITDELLPSIINTWNTADSDSQKSEIKEQLKSLIRFLENQLSAVGGNTGVNNLGPQDPLMLNMDKTFNTKIDNKISKNNHYIEMLNNQWH